MMRLGAASIGLLVVAQVAVYSPRALPSMILAAALIVAVFIVEEGRVRSARSGEKSAAKRVCRHGSTSFQPFDGDDAARSRIGGKR